jgi:Response regulator of the LytR/AlgR family
MVYHGKEGGYMLIGICDDEVIIRDDLVRLCHKWMCSNLTDIEIVCFSSSEELISKNLPIDILFLDIQMKGMNGMLAAEKIREHDESMLIIFLTGFKGFMQAGYRVRAFRYLLKPVNEEEFFYALTEAVNEITKNFKTVIGMDGETLFVKLKDIIYVECVERSTLVRTGKGSFESSTTMSEWEGILATGDFYRVHKSYIVNLEFIREIGKDVVLDNGEKVEVAIRQVAKLRKACMEYRRRNAR